MRLVMATRDPIGWRVPEIAAHVGLGASPRATLGLLAAGRALALLRGRRFLVPQDVADVAPEILRHRLILTYDALADGVTTDDVIGQRARDDAGAAGDAPAGERPAGHRMTDGTDRRRRAKASPPVARKAAELRRLELLVTRRLDGLLRGEFLGRAERSGLRGRRRARVRSRRRLALDRLEPHRAFAHTADPHDRSRSRAADVGRRRSLGEHELRDGRAREVRRRVRGGRRVRLPHRAARQPLRHARRRAATTIMRLGPTSTRPELLASLSRLYDMPRGACSAPSDDTDLAATLHALERARPRRGQVIVVSDFLDDTEWRASVRAPRARASGVVRAGGRSAASSRSPPRGCSRSSTPRPGRDIHVQSNSPALRDRYAAAARERHDAIAPQHPRGRERAPRACSPTPTG